MSIARRVMSGVVTVAIGGGLIAVTAPAAQAAPKVSCTKKVFNTSGWGSCSNYGPGSIRVKHVFDCSMQADMHSEWSNVSANRKVTHHNECRFSMRDVTAHLK
ncbi:hypothetical protein [Streptomyces sp. NPDC087300]|uniref:hypothetical protein n=1 Tax=Streptomyces sp. NPDC087300 TaxID=3365780 RepID=UPI00380A671C